MQALFYIGLFGTFFFVMSGMTVGVARTTFQAQVDRAERVDNVFKDIEYSMNRVYLRDQWSLPPIDGQNPNMDYMLPEISWSEQDITFDPWESPIRQARIDNVEPIAVFGPGESASARVSYFALMSAGPDRTLETSVPGTLEEWRTLHSEGPVGDDIVRTFSTREPMIETWNAAAEVELNLEDVLVRNYRQRVEDYENYDATATRNGQGEGNEIQQPITRFINCALLNQTNNQGNEYQCNDFTAGLIRECHAMHEYNLALAEYRQQAEEVDEVGGVPPQPPERPRTEIIPQDLATVTVGQCWRYDRKLKRDARYPTFVGAMGNIQDTCPNNNCSTQKLGIAAEVDRDPFGGIVVTYDNNRPDQVTVRRNMNVDGWTIVRNNVIRPE